MTTEKKCAHCEEPDTEIPSESCPTPPNLKKGKMSKAMEAALDAVENMGKPKKI